jgi:ABC-type taurine transport system substrate-binding protein
MTRATFIITLAALAIIAGTDRVAWSQESLKVAIPQRGAWDAGVAELGQRGGIFKKHGLDLEILYVQAGPESIQAVIGGSMDIATAAGVSAAVGTFAKGAPIRIIGSEMIGAPDLYWYVPANSPIRKVEDFNGKTVAFSLTGSSSHAALLALIAQYKLTAKPTSTGNIAATITQTMTGQVDVGFGAAPFGLDLVEDGKIRIIATGNDVASLRTRTVRVNLTDQREHAAEPPRRDRPFQSRLSGDGRMDVFRSGRAQALRRVFQSAGENRAASARAHPQGKHGHRTRRGDRPDHGRRGGGEVHSRTLDGRASEGAAADSKMTEPQHRRSGTRMG